MISIKYLFCDSLVSIDILTSVINMRERVFWGWNQNQTINVGFKENEIHSTWNTEWSCYNYGNGHALAHINYL